MTASNLYKKTPWLLAAAIAVAVLAHGAWQGYAIWQQSSRPKAVKPSAVTSGSSAMGHTIAQILPLHIFGRQLAVTAPVEQSTEDLPETNLSLILRGVSAVDENEGGGALIEGPDRQTNFFRIAEQMPGGVTLHSVHANRVVLDRNGKLENLLFPDTFDDTGFVTIYEAPDPEMEQPAYEEPQYQQEDFVEPTFSETVYEPAGESPENVSQEVSYEPPAYEISEPIDSEPVFTEPVYEETLQSDESALGSVPEVSNPALQALEEERKQEIRDRLQRLRDQIRARTEG